MTRKQKLLDNLNKHIFCRVGRSDIHGVGLIAIRDIKKDTLLFNLSNYLPERDELVDISEEEVSSLGEEVVSLIKSYTAISHLGTYALHENGLNNINLGYYLNHSDDPNIRVEMSKNANPYQYANFIAIKDIKKGEELTENYQHLSHDTKKLKEQFDFLK